MTPECKFITNNVAVNCRRNTQVSTAYAHWFSPQQSNVVIRFFYAAFGAKADISKKK